MKAFLESLGLFNEADIKEIESIAERRILKKGDFLIREGEICREAAILSKGILRSFYLSPTGEEITYCFLFPTCFVAAYSSLITGNPSAESLQAIAETEVYVISKQELDRLTDTHPGWQRLRMNLAEQQYVEFEKRIFSYQKEKALQRYIDLMTYQPEYIRHIPMQYLASYLVITPRHLSRLRREVVGRK